MRKVCESCGAEFEITDGDREFYGRMKVPEPVNCMNCRIQSLMCFRNERFLYKRKCDFTGEEILSVYPPDSPHKIYEQSVWSSDKWSPMDYGRDFDFERSFFEQMHELLLETPRISLHNRGNENSEFCNTTNDMNNCYLCFNCEKCEDCLYCTTASAKDSMDLFWCLNCELCYECIKTHESYHSFWCFNSANMTDSYFCEECKSCTNCFGCVGLRQKSYCIYNKQVSQEEYEAFMRDFDFSEEKIEEARRKLNSLRLELPHRNLEIQNSEDCMGDYITSSKNCEYCFDVMFSENCKNIWDGIVKNSQDCFNTGVATDFIYYSLAIYRSNNVQFCNRCNGSADMLYCDECRECENMFGCFGLKRKKYCILNKQYTKEEYEELLPRIIAHMKKTGEWGRFFSAKLSPCGYNTTFAQEYFPLNREEALEQGFNWTDYENPPISDSGENVRVCIDCEKPFRMIGRELKFYEKEGLPKPERCPDCRHWKRKGRINLRKLWDRKCDKCECDIKTSYSPDRPETVYCEKCYLIDIY